MVDVKKSIMQFLLWFNLIFIVVSIFYVTKGFTLMITIVNVSLVFTYFVMDKYSAIFEGLLVTNKLLKGMNNILGEA